MAKTLVGLLLVALVMLGVAAPANAVKPKAGSWFSGAVDPNDEDNLSSIQFHVANSRKKLTGVLVYWRCGKQSGFHTFRNSIPIAINKHGKFKLVGATTPPGRQSTKDFTLKGRFISRTKARYSMRVEKCGPKTNGKLTLAED